MPLSPCTYSSALLAHVLRLTDTPNHPSYVVGGFVRDAAMGRASTDIDIAVHGNALKIARQAAEAVGGTYVALKEERRIARVVVPAHEESDPADAAALVQTLDFVGFEGDILDDLSRRDFTINAIAVPSATVAEYFEKPDSGLASLLERALDPYDGLGDIESGILRMVGPQAFVDDAGRLLRAIRLSAQFHLRFDGATEDHLRAASDRVKDVSGERSREELLKILELDQAADSLRRMDRLGLLTALIPDLEAGRGVEQPTSHFWDVLEHSLQSVAAFEFIAGEGDWQYGNEETLDCVPTMPCFQAYLSKPVSIEATHSALIKLACLLHDVAKPDTKTLTETGRARFLGHTKEGSQMSRTILRRLRFSQAETSYIQALVHDHLRPAQMSSEGLPSGRAVYRFFRDTKDAACGILYLAMADYLACRGPLYTMREWTTVCDLTRFILDEHARQEQAVRPLRLIDGNDIMGLLGVGPGPIIGTVLDEVLEAQASGHVHTREDALALARTIYERELKTVRTAK